MGKRRPLGNVSADYWVRVKALETEQKAVKRCKDLIRESENAYRDELHGLITREQAIDMFCKCQDEAKKMGYSLYNVHRDKWKWGDCLILGWMKI